MKNQNGLIMLRITVDKKRAEISIKRTMDPVRWDSKSSRVRGNKEDAREVNCLIDQLTLKINGIYNKLVERQETITAKKIKNIFVGKDNNQKTLMETFTSHNEMMKSGIGIDFSKSTFTRYSTTYDHITRFLKHQYDLDDIRLKELQFSFITNLEHFLKVERKCNHNSSQKYIRNFRKIINIAVRNDWVDKDPFKAYRVKLKDTKRVFLTKEELAALENAQISVNRLDQVRDVFIFCCYTGLHTLM